MKIMKKIAFIALLTVLPALGFSQSVFDRFEDLDNVSAVVVNKSMFNLLSKIDVEVDDPEAEEFMSIAKSLNGLKVFSTEDAKISADMKATVESYLKSAKLEELMRVKDKDANVKFYIKSGKDQDHVSELLMFVTGMKNADVAVNGRKFETVLLSLTGDIDLNKIGSLTKKMNLPEELNKAGKKNK
jgi:tellurite resistance protein